ncbi:hypothetical protein RIF29_30048 [Crotalaria pallida]|uniref:MSL3 chromodomain-like domain-containing protein n=1 Tax=Crotalaria pallida TaxID=3830 RepID=A0AAN9EGG7_CROPI
MRHSYLRQSKTWPSNITHMFRKPRGWKRSWDEWVGMDRLMKDTEETKHKKLELDEKSGSDKKAKCDATASKSFNVEKGRKRKNDFVVEGKFDENEAKPMNLEIPPTLWKRVMDLAFSRAYLPYD